MEEGKVGHRRSEEKEEQRKGDGEKIVERVRERNVDRRDKTCEQKSVEKRGDRKRDENLKTAMNIEPEKI